MYTCFIRNNVLWDLYYSAFKSNINFLYFKICILCNISLPFTIYLTIYKELSKQNVHQCPNQVNKIKHFLSGLAKNLPISVEKI